VTDEIDIRISSQSVESHIELAEKTDLKYTLLSDCGNIARQLSGVPGRVIGLIPDRVAYVPDRSGKEVCIFDA
jgi:peroxiredoxin Q/BCP